MDTRHLLPEEFDTVLDSDVGFGLTPLRAHLRGCAECRAELEDRRAFLSMLEELPHHLPSPLFADRVMSRVHVFEPWYVTLRDELTRLVPTSRPARVLAGAAAAMTALVVSTAAMILFARTDAVLFMAELGLDRARTALLGGVGSFLTTLLGDGAMDALATAGPRGAISALGILLVSLVLAVLLLRSATAASRRHRT